jgi:hypothetical protein
MGWPNATCRHLDEQDQFAAIAGLERGGHRVDLILVMTVMLGVADARDRPSCSGRRRVRRKTAPPTAPAAHDRGRRV